MWASMGTLASGPTNRVQNKQDKRNLRNTDSVGNRNKQTTTSHTVNDILIEIGRDAVQEVEGA